MNIIAVVILLTILIEIALNITADILNLNHIRDDIPQEFQDVYDTDRYKQSQEYLKVNTRYGWIVTVFDLTVLLVFWFGTGFQIMDVWVRSLNCGTVVSGLIYMGLLFILKVGLSLPFTIYHTFGIEERFGFNKTTPKLFLWDTVKGLSLTMLIGAPLLAGIIAFLEYSGSNAWLYCWITVVVVMLIIQYIAPTWIMPLFNKFEPLSDCELKDAILSYAQSVKFPLDNVYVMDGSKRSTKSNAFFTGFGKHKRIALFDTLIARHSVPELVAILAHEIGHYKKRHILKGLTIGILHTGVVFYLLSFCLSYRGLYDAFYVSNISVYTGLIFFGMLFSPVNFFMGLGLQAFSRKNEYEADKFVIDTIGDAQSFAKALKKLSADNLSNLFPHPFYVFLNYSHPPVLERINAILP